MSDIRLAALFEKSGVEIEIEAEYRRYASQFGGDTFANPFVPPRNSLLAQATAVMSGGAADSGSAGLIDYARVQSCFARAIDIYKNIMSTTGPIEPARLYKLGWKEEATAKFFERLDREWETLERISSVADFNRYMEGLQTKTDRFSQAMYGGLSSKRATIEEALVNIPAVKERSLKLAYKDVKKYIGKECEIIFFRSLSRKTYDVLQQDFAVYKPGEDTGGRVTHSWGTNLAWILGHIRKGNRIIVCSDILSNQHRSSYEDTPSAFARELCVALKAGYTLHKTADGIELRPDGLEEEHLLSCDSTGRLGDGVNPSFEEINSIYRLLESQGFDQLAEFSCTFGFAAGDVQILPRTGLVASFAAATSAYEDVGREGGGGSAAPLLISGDPMARASGDAVATAAGVDRDEVEAERLRLATVPRGGVLDQRP